MADKIICAFCNEFKDGVLMYVGNQLFTPVCNGCLKDELHYMQRTCFHDLENIDKHGRCSRCGTLDAKPTNQARLF